MVSYCENDVAEPIISMTPSTSYETTAPTGFSVVSKYTDNYSTMNFESWSEWEYISGSFVEKKYSYGISSSSSLSLTPDDISSSVFSNGEWTMRSGYGYEVLLNVTTTNTVIGTTTPNTESVTMSQEAELFLPEYSYSKDVSKYVTLKSTSSNAFKLFDNLQYTPLWYPNADYIAKTYVSEIWTPMGMVSGYVYSNTININGSAYDDWYIGR